MKSATSFRDILAQKMNVNDSSHSDFDNTYQDKNKTNYYRATLDSLLGQVPKVEFSHIKPSGYKVDKSNIFKAKTPRPNHNLNANQLKAFEFFNEFLKSINMEISASYSQRELKKAFRLLALRLHPDKNGGYAAPFLELKLNYNLLLNVFQISTAKV